MRLKILFNKYLDNNCTSEELQELFQLLKDEEQLNSLDPELRKVWKEMPEMQAASGVDWHKMISGIRETKVPAANKIRKITGWSIGIAASVLIIGLLIWNNNETALPAEPVLALNEDTVINAKQQNEFVYLPDGSSIILNAGSSMKYNKKKYREIYLSGEAYFDVRQHANSPFLVHTGSITTRVLGTAFNINASPKAQRVKVTVSSGKVQVSGSKENMAIVNANEQIVVDAHAAHFDKQTVDVKKEIKWRPEELVIDDQAFAELAAFLEARFDCRISFYANNLKAQKVTATFKETDSLEEILEVICGITASKYTKENNIYIIKNL